MVEFTLLPAIQLLRLVALPIFGWVAYRDYRTRRVPRRVWVPLYLLGGVIAVMLGVTGITTTLLTGEPLPLPTIYFYLSVGVMLTIAVVFTRFGLLGRADGHALVVLGMLFPTRTAVQVTGVPLLGGVLSAAGGRDAVGTLVLPVLRPPVGVPLSLVILQLGAYIGALIIGWVAWRNVRSGAVSLAALRAQPGLLFQALTARRVPWDGLLETDGWVLTDAAAPTTGGAGGEAGGRSNGAGGDAAPGDEPAGDTDADSGVSGEIGKDGFDLDVLRMYCRWRGLPLATLRAAPTTYRDPATLPAAPNPPTDGRVDPALDPDPPGDGAGDRAPETRAAPDAAGAAGGGDDGDDTIPDGGRPGREHHAPRDEPPTEVTTGGPAVETDAEGDTAGVADPTTVTDGEPTGDGEPGPAAADGTDDPWGAAAFVADVETTYGTSAAELRTGLNHVTAAATGAEPQAEAEGEPAMDAYWVSVGLPFLVPLTIGLVVAVTIGSPF